MKAKICFIFLAWTWENTKSLSMSFGEFCCFPGEVGGGSCPLSGLLTRVRHRPRQIPGSEGFSLLTPSHLTRPARILQLQTTYRELPPPGEL